MGVAIGVSIGAAGIALTVYFAFQTLKAANQQNAATLEALGLLRVEVAKVETRTALTQESLVPLVRSALEAARSQAPRDAETAIRQVAPALQLDERAIGLLTETVRGAVSESLERAEEAAALEMQDVAPEDVPEDVIAAVGAEAGNHMTVVEARRRSGRGAPLWSLDTSDGRHWDVTRTRWGITVYPDARQ
jgi:hypothetical protein